MDRIYIIKHGDKVIAYKPIDAVVLDHYLMTQVNNGFSKLSTSTHALKSFFRFLNNNRHFPNIVPFMKFKLSDYSPIANEVRILSRHELLRYLQSLISHSENLVHDTLLFSLLLSTGCRISEILNLKISDIDYNDEMILLLKTKNKIQRVVVLREGFGAILREYQTSNNLQVIDYLFPSKTKSSPLTKSDVDKLFKRFLNLANLPPMRIHSIRHSFATHMRDAGIDLLTLMELLGHQKLQSTLNYTQSHYTRNANIKIKEHDDFYHKFRTKIKSRIQM
ncbi:site-specific recombinase XerD [Paenibacillus anaericanus]|uniref:tyrosine-type recombinase/integrase n=1 Tax=Paenibacillus anaericanus TaxID=170367 RepID=UPI0027867E3D|nr:tyrosine-type recombinase/integrase [Paenibacillus anaericanus]MDQ0090118.1 site-specific recombinase XerD [Paenibacillus anaericanus]